MRFTSPYAKYKITALKQGVEWLANGAWRETRPGFICEFEPQAFTTWERDEALKYYGDRLHTGRRKLDATLTTDTPVTWRIGTWDSSVIDDLELRKKVEEALLAHESYGRDFMHFEKPRTPKPWAKYDTLKAGGRGRTNDMVADEILKLVREIGADPGQVMAYESENLNRPEVMDAMALYAERDGQPEVIEVGA